MIITHCELLEDKLIIIFDTGLSITLTRDDAIRLAHGIVHYSNQTAAADLSEIFDPNFNWTLLQPSRGNTNPGSNNVGCKSCGPTNWKPKKDEI